MQRKDGCICQKSFYARDISKEPGIVCITKPQVGFLSFFFLYSGFLCNFNVPEQTLKMSGISE